MDTTNKSVPQSQPVEQRHGQGVRALVEARQHELELELAQIQKGAPGKSSDVEAALSALKALLTGNLDQIPPVLAQELNRWIETSKYLGTSKPVPKLAEAHNTSPGLALRAVIEARHRQHELDLSELKISAPDKVSTTETALMALKALLGGALDQIPANVAEELGEFIKTSKHLGAKA